MRCSGSRTSTSRFAGRSFASKTNSSISGFFPGQPNDPPSEKSHSSYLPSSSEPLNVSNFVDKTKRRTCNVPRTLLSSDSLETRSTKYSADKDGSRVSSENLTGDRSVPVSHSEGNSDTPKSYGRDKYTKKSVDSILNLTETRANNSTGGTQDDKGLNFSLKRKSSCPPCLIEIPFGSIPIDVMVGCGNSKDSSFLKRAAKVVSDRPCNYPGNSSPVDGTASCRSPSSSNSSISRSRSSTSSTSEGPDNERPSLALETGAQREQTRVARALSPVDDISSCAQQLAESRHSENIDCSLLLTDPASDCSRIDRDDDDSMNTVSSISNIPPSVSQKDLTRGPHHHRRKHPLLHMTISSSSDVEFLFNRTPSETSTRSSELSIVVVESPGSGTETGAPAHITRDNGSPSEQCRVRNDITSHVFDVYKCDLTIGNIESD